MEKVYKSRRSVLLIAFFRKLFWAIPAVMLIGIFAANMVQDGVSSWPADRVQTLFLVMFIAAIYIVIVTGFAVYVSFFRLNITAKVTQNEITLLRGKKVFKIFSSQEHSFDSRVVKHYHVFVTMSRYLRVYDKNCVKGVFKKNFRDYRLCFSQDDFADFIAIVTAISLMQAH